MGFCIIRFYVRLRNFRVGYMFFFYKTSFFYYWLVGYRGLIKEIMIIVVICYRGLFNL